MKKIKGTRKIVLIIVLAALVLGYYFYLSNRNTPAGSEETDVETMTESERVLSRDLQTNYPPTPREVVKYFSEITECFYNEEHTDEELQALGLRMREIYDDELVNNQKEETYLDLLKSDVEDFKESGRTISSFAPSSSLDVEIFEKDGHECARLYCVYDIKQDGLLYQTTLCFILRKDEDSHYKIYGWKAVNPNKQTSE